MKKRFAFVVLICGLFFVLVNVQITKASTKYKYDNLNRITRIEYEDGSYIEYEYDRAGNIISEKKVTTKTSAVDSGLDNKDSSRGGTEDKNTSGVRNGDNSGLEVDIGNFHSFFDITYKVIDGMVKETIPPKKPLKLKGKVSGKKVTLSWKKDKSVKGTYVYASKKKNKNFKRVKILKGTKNKVTLKKSLYRYYKIRSYKLVNRNKVFSKYSTTIKIITQ